MTSAILTFCHSAAVKTIPDYYTSPTNSINTRRREDLHINTSVVTGVDRILQQAQKNKDTQGTPQTASMFAQVNDRKVQAARELASLADRATGLFDLGANDWTDAADGLRRLCSSGNTVAARDYYPDDIKSNCIKSSIRALASQLVMLANCRPMDPALLTAEDVIIPCKGKFIYLSSLAALQAATGVDVIGP